MIESSLPESSIDENRMKTIDRDESKVIRKPREMDEESYYRNIRMYAKSKAPLEATVPTTY